MYSWNKALEGMAIRQKAADWRDDDAGAWKTNGRDYGRSFSRNYRRKSRSVWQKDLYRVENKWVESAPCHIYEGLEETIRELSGRYQLMIVSNSQAGYIEAFLKNTGLGEYFADHVCFGDTEIP